MDRRGCSQIVCLGYQHLRQQVSAEGLQTDPGWGLGKWSVFCCLSCYVTASASCYIVASFVKDNYIVSHASYCVTFCYISVELLHYITLLIGSHTR